MLRRSAQALCRGGGGVWRIVHQQDQAPVVRRFLTQLASSDSAAVLRAGVLSSLGQGRRNFADEAKSSEGPPPEPVRAKVPKFMPGVIGRYATSLYITGKVSGVLDQVESEIKELAKTIAQSPEFKTFAEYIFLEKRERVQAIKDLFANTNLHPFTKNFMAILAEDGRLKDFGKIAAAFSEIMFAHRGCVKATITTADELSDSELEKVKANVVSQLLEPGQTVFIEQKVDEDIIGGVVVEVGDRILDLSIAKRIQRIEKILMESL